MPKKKKRTLDYTVSATVDKETYERIQELKRQREWTTSKTVRAMLEKQIAELGGQT